MQLREKPVWAVEQAFDAVGSGDGEPDVREDGVVEVELASGTV